MVEYDVKFKLVEMASIKIEANSKEEVEAEFKKVMDADGMDRVERLEEFSEEIVEIKEVE